MGFTVHHRVSLNRKCCVVKQALHGLFQQAALRRNDEAQPVLVPAHNACVMLELPTVGLAMNKTD